VPDGAWWPRSRDITVRPGVPADATPGAARAAMAQAVRAGNLSHLPLFRAPRTPYPSHVVGFPNSTA
jgi:hypothetical protein